MEADHHLRETLRHLRLAEELLQRAVSPPRRAAGGRRTRPDQRLGDVLDHVSEAADDLEGILTSRLAFTHPEAFIT
ncbi:MAG: hypothetical protein IT200_12185 [Thermoleophilia bacterium]|nr:hypothetical protein [Thermoleophilia bacterium]